MKNKFDEYLKSRRHRMDVEEPDDALIWEGIRKDFEKPPKFWQGYFWKIAAVFIFLASSAYVIYNEVYRSQTNIYNITLSDIEPDYAARVAGYRTTIDQKWEQVQEVDPAEMKKLAAFFKELDDLDKMYREYQEDYHSYGYNEQLIKAMMDYYDKRVRVLDRMLMEIQKHKNYEKRKEQTDI